METVGTSKLRIRRVEVRRIIGHKNVKDRIYSYEYFTLSLNLYIPRNIVEKFGSNFIVVRDEEQGIITIMPQKLAERKGIRVEQ
ncbi:MAG: hypothetical protein N3D82_03790 [Ignisphaera sp.]|nr:hypothetical protein [Ignisphaera sp.]MCX8168129.1 hypothetical protein [Ignisphaera sp.]MDW8085436.1 hypothetical protein [Ignisphaera sp.]